MASFLRPSLLFIPLCWLSLSLAIAGDEVEPATIPSAPIEQPEAVHQSSDTAVAQTDVEEAANAPEDADGETSGDDQGEAGHGLGTVARVSVHGIIDGRQLRYMRRAMAEAKAVGANTIITHINSPGGQLFAAIELVEHVIQESRRQNVRMIAWIDQSAYSAAAMLAYGHHDIYMRPNAIIGNIGIVFQGPDGELKYAPEKIETALRTILRATADERGWDKALLVKMTARNQELHEARFEDGRRIFVIEDDRGSFLADHPEIDPENPQQWVLVAGHDRLLTFTGNEALERQMATGLVDSIEDLYAHLGVQAAEVHDFSPTPVELTARRLGAIAPLFISLALLFIIFEFKTPGVGLFAILAAVCGSIFFVLQYYQDLVGNWEYIAMAIGMSLIILELLTMFGGGILFILGGLITLTGLLGAFLPADMSWDFDNTYNTEALQIGLINLTASLFLIIFGMVLFVTFAPRLGLLDRLSVSAVIGGTSKGESNLGSGEDGASPVGKHGVISAECRPSGTVILDGRSYSASAEHSAFIAPGTPVEVIGEAFGELLVRPLQPQDSEGVA
ncbi:MAG: hypothetical protein EA402_14540 [Planctomycetota bacterium]|nr:MAG: hypothetical protein EA402_14540 [Planctomycetota bacterium]